MPWYRMRTDLGGPLQAVFHLQGQKLPCACGVCGFMGGRLCDWRLPEGRTCDRSLCMYCTTQPARGKDLCPAHALAWRAWLAGRTNSTDGPGPMRSDA